METPDVRPLVVVKVGGSLLGWPAFPERLAAYFRSRAKDRLILIVGGGRAADWVRDLDRDHGIGPDRSHALALRALDLTAHVTSTLVPGLDVVENPGSFGECWEAGRIPLLAPRRYLNLQDRESNAPLPHSWDVTTDSISARVALDLGAAELALIKSAPPPGRGRSRRGGAAWTSRSGFSEGGQRP